MFSNKLAEALRLVKQHPLQKWYAFLDSPFFNDDSRLSNLARLLMPELDGAPELSKEAVWASVMPHQPFNDGLLRQLASALTALALEFVNVVGFQNDRLSYHLALLEKVATPHLTKHHNAVLRKINDLETDCHTGSAEFHRAMQQKNTILHRLNEQTQRLDITFDNLQAAARHTDTAYYATRLQQYCEIPGYALFRPIKQYPQPTREWLLALDQSDVVRDPAVYPWRLVFTLLTQPNDDTYHTLHDYLRRNDRLYTPSMAYQLYTHLKNYCIYQKINKGHDQWYAGLFDLYKHLLDTKLLLHDGPLDPQHYKNIITIGIRLKHLEWTQQFIHDYTMLLPEGNKDNTKAYNLAKIALEAGHYQQVIELLSKIEFKDQTIALGAKLMLLKTYYALKEWSALNYLLDSFSIYLRRHKNINSEVRQQYMAVIKFTRKLTKWPTLNKENRIKLKAEVESAEALPSKQWILAQMT